MRGSMRDRHSGFTLAEVMVTIVIFTLVSLLLAFPLFSAFGYIQKAMARHEAQVAASKAVNQFSHEFSTAMYVFDLPPDGSWVSFLTEYTASASAQNLGLPMNIDSSALNLCYVRYGRVPAFPWIVTKDAGNNSFFTLLHPDYLASGPGDALTYSNYWRPYYVSNVGGAEFNPYIVARFAPLPSSDTRSQWSNLWSLAGNQYVANTATTLNGCYPMSDRAPMAYSPTNRNVLWQSYHNDMISITPLGDEWDIPRFQATPLRLMSESLMLQVDAQGHTLPTQAISRYPLWIGRSREIDDLSDAQLGTLYPNRTIDQLDDLLQQWTFLYPTRRKNPAWQAGTPPTAPNPYGYQVRVTDASGTLVYGSNYESSTNTFSMTADRHFMDWPPIDRPDWNWAPSEYLWSSNDISRQRMEGRLVFAQPVAPINTTALQITNYVPTDNKPVLLPIPGGHWKTGLTRLVSAPTRLLLSNGGTTKLFKLVNKTPKQLGPGEFCVDTVDKVADPDNVGQTRLAWRHLAFGEPLSGTWTIAAGHEREATYTISDLQPDDVVVATYSTKAVLNVALTVSRQDRAGKLQFSRQDYPINMQLEASNALKRARGNR